MSISLGRYEFEGPHTVDSIANRAAIYAVIRSQGSDVELLDVGEARELRHHLQRHHLYKYWTRGLPGGVSIFVHYMPAILDERRREIAHEIRQELEPEWAA